MDPITLAVVSALAKLSENVIADAYQALKAAIAQKCGVDSDVTQALENLEKKPDSNGRIETLKEEVVAAKIDQDQDLLNAAQALLSKLKDVPGGQTIINQTITGNQNIFSGTGNVTGTNKS
jgi:HetE-like protein